MMMSTAAAVENITTTTTTTITKSTSTAFVPPSWMIEFVKFRKRLFLQTVEPIIVTILGPVVDDAEGYDESQLLQTMMMPGGYNNTTTTLLMQEQEEEASLVSIFPARLDAAVMNNNTNTTTTMMDFERRRLSFLPSYVEDINHYRDSSMNFATLAMLFVLMACMLMVFLSCFYHNQKTSPLFISPRRHRLPKLVPPPLPVDGYFAWVRSFFLFLKFAKIFEGFKIIESRL